VSDPKDSQPPKGRRSGGGSLIERAGSLYDFDAVLRARVGSSDGEVPSSSQPGDMPLSVPLPPHREMPAWPAPSATEGWSHQPGAPAFEEPEIVHRVAKVNRAELIDQGFVMPDAAITALAEEFRIVKRALLLNAVGPTALPNGRRVLICSANPNEGKTFCAVNLALSMANERDIEVLLIDGDFAKPTVLSTLGIDGPVGLMDALADTAIDVETLVIKTDIGNLSVLPSGKYTNEATELIAADRTRAIIERLAHRPNRIILFDSPPALAASPASVLAYHVGQVLLVVRADKTGEAELRDAVLLLGGCEEIQLLLNGARFAPNARRFGSYYGYEAPR